LNANEGTNFLQVLLHLHLFPKASKTAARLPRKSGCHFPERSMSNSPHWLSTHSIVSSISPIPSLQSPPPSFPHPQTSPVTLVSPEHRTTKEQTHPATTKSKLPLQAKIHPPFTREQTQKQLQTPKTTWNKHKSSSNDNRNNNNNNNNKTTTKIQTTSTNTNNTSSNPSSHKDQNFKEQ
jgi:hypothetical protein